MSSLETIVVTYKEALSRVLTGTQVSTVVPPCLLLIRDGHKEFLKKLEVCELGEEDCILPVYMDD